MAYTKTSWQDGAPPAITSAQLNRMEQGIFDAHAHMTSQTNPHNVTASQVKALPTAGGTITGGLATGSDRWWIGATTPTFGLNLNGSSIIGVDELLFKGQANGDGIGLYFLKNGAAADSSKIADYNVFRVDGSGIPYVGGSRMITDKDKDIKIGDKIRILTSDDGIGYFHGGNGDKDTNAEIRITRTYTALDKIKVFRVQAENAYFSDTLEAKNVKSSGAECYAKWKNITWGTGSPSGGSDGDIYIQY